MDESVADALTRRYRFDCRFFYFEPYHRGYSEVTPGSDAEIGCSWGIWKMNNLATLREFRMRISSANECQSFQQREG